jgi:hypothetical protein
MSCAILIYPGLKTHVIEKTTGQQSNFQNVFADTNDG